MTSQLTVPLSEDHVIMPETCHNIVTNENIKKDRLNFF